MGSKKFLAVLPVAGLTSTGGSLVSYSDDLIADLENQLKQGNIPVRINYQGFPIGHVEEIKNGSNGLEIVLDITDDTVHKFFLGKPQYELDLMVTAYHHNSNGIMILDDATIFEVSLIPEKIMKILPF